MCSGLIVGWCVYVVCIIRCFTTRVKTHVRGPKAETTGTERELVSSPAPKLSDHKSGTLSQGPTGTWRQSEVAPGNWGFLTSRPHEYTAILIYYWYKQRYLLCGVLVTPIRVYIYIGTTVDKYVITAATGLLDYIIRYTLRENSISVSLFFFFLKTSWIEKYS